MHCLAWVLMRPKPLGNQRSMRSLMHLLWLVASVIVLYNLRYSNMCFCLNDCKVTLRMLTLKAYGINKRISMYDQDICLSRNCTSSVGQLVHTTFINGAVTFSKRSKQEWTIYIGHSREKGDIMGRDNRELFPQTA